jgi:serine/threonine protein kinase
VAIKAELKTAKVPQLVFEYGVLRELNGELGVPAVYWFGDHGDCNVLVMQRLGPSVTAVKHRLFQVPQRVSLVKHIARSVLQALHALHRNGFVHRDLKPENMLWETQPRTEDAFTLPRVYLIDFGLAKRVWMPTTGVHVSCCTGKHLTGTPRYAAAHAHAGVELSRRDDIESFGSAPRSTPVAKTSVLPPWAVTNSNLLQKFWPRVCRPCLPTPSPTPAPWPLKPCPTLSY